MSRPSDRSRRSRFLRCVCIERDDFVSLECAVHRAVQAATLLVRVVGHAPAMRILAKIEDADRRVLVLERRADGSRVYLDRGVLYTGIDAAGRNNLAYVAAMAEALPREGSVLVLGTAGGALPSLLHAAGLDVTTVDNWAGAFEIARRWFQMPPDITCVEADAVQFLQQPTRRWSAIAVDVFNQMTIPSSLLTSTFGASLAHALAPGGVVVWNVAAGARQMETWRVLETLRGACLAPRTRSLHGDDILANTLVIGRKALRARRRP